MTRKSYDELREKMKLSGTRESKSETINTKTTNQACSCCGKVVEPDEWNSSGLCETCLDEEDILNNLEDYDNWEWFKSYPKEKQFYRLATLVVFNNPFLISHVREDLIDERLCLKAVMAYLPVIEHIPDHFKTEEFFIQVVKENPWNIFYVPSEKQGEPVCWTALKKEPAVIKYIRKPTTEMMMYVYEKDASLEKYFKI